MTVANTGELLGTETVPVEPVPMVSGEQARSSTRVIYAATFATEFLVMLTQIALYKLVASWLGQTGFAEYALVRRVVSFLQPLTMLGFGVGLPRFLALADGRGEARASSRYLRAAVLCVGAVATMTTVALLVWPRWFSYLFFGGPEHQNLVPPLAFVLIGMSTHSILYAFLRGKLAVGRANLLQAINYGLVPFLVFIRFHKNAAELLWYLGFAWTATAGLLLITALRPGRWENPLNSSRELLRYGLQRVPGDFAFMALLALPAVFIAHFGGIREAGIVAFALAIVNMIASGFSPVGIVLLPKVSRAIGDGDFQFVRREIALISRLTLLLAGATVLLLEFTGGSLIRIYLGEGFTPALPLIRVLIIGGLPLAFYTSLRSAIDAVHHKAVNTLNLLVVLAVFVAVCEIGLWSGNLAVVYWAFLGSLFLLAVLTQIQVQKILQLTGPSLSRRVSGIVGANLNKEGH